MVSDSLNESPPVRGNVDETLALLGNVTSPQRACSLNDHVGRDRTDQKSVDSCQDIHVAVEDAFANFRQVIFQDFEAGDDQEAQEHVQKDQRYGNPRRMSLADEDRLGQGPRPDHEGQGNR